MSSRFYRKIGSLFGLLAILMATLAPTVSQAIAASRGAYDPATALCSSHTAALADTHEDDPTDTHTLASHWHACGYCSLLAHFPVLPASPSTFALTVTAITQQAAARFDSVALAAPYQAAQPRAPPVHL
ncbi:DUF2946 domain-containing protein [Paraburkholderia diazotrophica]|uniref:DUF2946 domain-containing protein n=1 Tax=Paraburkholderia diazotrophica TaxID=667676 RepID=UPI00316BA8F5